MDILIVTGMSGAGKSQAIMALEDIGYYCVDNVPPALIPKFAELSAHTGGQIEQMAIVVDTRSQGVFEKLLGVISQLREEEYQVQTLFLECDDTVLATRYKETRRRHPLASREGISTVQAIKKERELLTEIRAQAEYLVDTSLLSAIQLKDHIRKRFLADDKSYPMNVTMISFGFKYGTPQDADLLFDVRCLKNPYYILELRPQTGLDAPVREYVLEFAEARELLVKLKDMLDFLIPLYIKEGKSSLVIAIGCTGGKHRSVVFAEELAEHLSQQGMEVITLHRDAQRG